MSDKEKTDNEFVDKIKFLAILSGFYALGLASGTADQMMKTIVLPPLIAVFLTDFHFITKVFHSQLPEQKTWSLKQ